MAKTKTLFAMYSGYVGDDKWNQFRREEQVVPEGTMSGRKYLDWLSQKGFGYGYFNNSGRYVVFFKLKVPVDHSGVLGYGFEMFHTLEDYGNRLKEMKAHSKRMHKQNPY